MIRRAIVATAGWPGVRELQASLYRRQAEWARAAVAAVPGIEAAQVFGSALRRPHAGLSDIDLLVVLRESLEPAQELEAIREVQSRVRRSGPLARLVRDVHVLTGRELELLARLGDSFLVRLQLDAGDALALPAWSPPPPLRREAILREACLWLRVAMRLLLTARDGLAALQAGRAWDKLEALLDALEGPELDLVGAVRAYSEPARRRQPLCWERVLASLARIDPLLPPAPAVPPGEAERHPGIDAVLPRVEAWLLPLRRHQPLAAAVLSVEGACERDLRLLLALDPQAPRAADTLHALARRCRDETPLPPEHACRQPLPQIVTPGLLDRSVFLRWSGLEPVARGRHGRWLHGREREPRATSAELARALALEVVRSGSELRALAVREMGPAVAARWSDLVRGLLPAAAGFLSGKAHATRYAPSRLPDATEALVRALSDSALRTELFCSIRSELEWIAPALVERAELAMGGGGE
ncbi:MAG: nucleotidyltransferase domain-containing protein [Myxococcota bacterium]|nr:nucleotidyltransferase domain-containing protein [Myxococcota bacterium]